jgi:hypothetical protein
MLATNAIPKTRINLNARVGLEMQDDTFAPNTADPASSGRSVRPFQPQLSGAAGNDRQFPNAMATVYQVKLSANSHPIPNTDAQRVLRLRRTQRHLNQYKVYGGGTGRLERPGSPHGRISSFRRIG